MAECPYGRLVDALNRLHDETDSEALSVRFSRSDVPIEWDEETNRWTEECHG